MSNFIRARDIKKDDTIHFGIAYCVKVNEVHIYDKKAKVVVVADTGRMLRLSIEQEVQVDIADLGEIV